MFKHDAVCGMNRLFLDFEDATYTKSGNSYILKATTPNGKTQIDFTLTPRKKAIRHGLDGVVKGHDGDDMFYYFIPNCSLCKPLLLYHLVCVLVSRSAWRCLYSRQFHN